jgi:hypothetical protein
MNDDLFTPNILHKLTRGPVGAMALGSFLTLVVIGFLFVLIENAQAYGIVGLIATLAMWTLAFLFGAGILASNVRWLRDRFQKVSATVMVAGNDDEGVDRSVITIRVMAEEHRLKVEKVDVHPEVPPELQHLNLKFRALAVEGSMRKMQAFSVKAEEYLKTIGMKAEISGDAADEVLKRDE